KSRTRLYDVWRRYNKQQKEQHFADIVVLTQADFQLLPVSESSTNLKARSRSSTSVTTSPPSTSSYSPPLPTFTAPRLPLAKRQRDFSEVSSGQKRRRLCDLNSELDEFALANSVTINQVIGYLL
ncbi:unnamed protein product, partial [Rotaria sordida]